MASNKPQSHTQLCTIQIAFPEKSLLFYLIKEEQHSNICDFLCFTNWRNIVLMGASFLSTGSPFGVFYFFLSIELILWYAHIFIKFILIKLLSYLCHPPQVHLCIAYIYNFCFHLYVTWSWNKVGWDHGIETIQWSLGNSSLVGIQLNTVTLSQSLLGANSS